MTPVDLSEACGIRPVCVVIRLVILLFMVEVAADPLGYGGKTILQVSFLVFFAVVSVYERGTELKPAERERQ